MDSPRSILIYSIDGVRGLDGATLWHLDFGESTPPDSGPLIPLGGQSERLSG